MNTITQTNRTILFEEINPEKLNLLTLVGRSSSRSPLSRYMVTCPEKS